MAFPSQATGRILVAIRLEPCAMSSSLAAPSTTVPGLGLCRAAAAEGVPRYFHESVDPRIATTLSIGMTARSSLKAAFWESTADERPISGDLEYVNIVQHGGGGRVWRDREPVPAETGSVGMHPFETCRFRFAGPVRYGVVSVPFVLFRDVCESLFERELTHDQLWIPMGTRDERLCGAMRTIREGLLAIEPTDLILDSWALILAEILVQGFSSHAQRTRPHTLGAIPSRGVAHVVDFIEANINQDLHLASLSRVAAMSVFHFARRFKQTVGVSPHTYIMTRRLSRAKALLQRSKHRLVDIAAACGFSSQAHFTAAFHRRVGVTPGTFRRSFTS